MTEHQACPCLHTTPCHPRCTCVIPASSQGCRFCCSYGSEKQRKAAATILAKRLRSPITDKEYGDWHAYVVQYGHCYCSTPKEEGIEWMLEHRNHASRTVGPCPLCEGSGWLSSEEPENWPPPSDAGGWNDTTAMNIALSKEREETSRSDQERKLRSLLTMVWSSGVPTDDPIWRGAVAEALGVKDPVKSVL